MVNKCGIMTNVKFLEKMYALKNSLGPDNTSDKQYQEYAEQINIYKKLVSKTNKMHIKKFHKEIRNLKTQNPKDSGK